MKVYIFLFLLGFSLLACGTSQNNDTSQFNQNTLSRQNAIQCLDTGDLSCAKNNFCGLQNENPGDSQLALRCCVSQFLNIAFSENTQSLGKMLGYQPASFASLKSNSLENLISHKKIVFGELIFVSEGKAPKLKDLVFQWGQKLTTDQASTRDLNQKLIQLGANLEGVSQCLTKLPSNFPEDELEGNFFGSREKTKISKRDIAFLQFASGSLAYLFQSVFQYEWGFENFPSWPFENSFYADINGSLSEADQKFGDLATPAASKIVARGLLLKTALQSFENFLHESKTGLIDLWLRWRFSQEDLITYTSILRSAYASVNSGRWMSVSGEDFILNTSSLLQENTLPNAKNIPDSVELLQRDEEGDPKINSAYLKQLFRDLVYIPTH